MLLRKVNYRAFESRVGLDLVADCVLLRMHVLVTQLVRHMPRRIRIMRGDADDEARAAQVHAVCSFVAFILRTC